MSAPLRELCEIGRPHIRTAVGIACSASGRIFSRAPFSFSMVGFTLAAPGSTLLDVNDWFDGQNVSGARLVPQTRALDARTLADVFAVPEFVIQSAEDFTTPTSLARSFVDSIRAPAKHSARSREAGASRYS